MPVKKSAKYTKKNTDAIRMNRTKQPTEDVQIMAGMKTPAGLQKRKPGRPWDRRPIPQLPPNDVRKTKYDWDKARELFITSEPAINLKQLAARTGIPYQQVRNRSTKERWIAVRAQEKLATLKTKRQEQLQHMAAQSMEFDQTSVDVAKLGQGIIAQRLVELTKFAAARSQDVDLIVQKLRAGDPVNRKDLYSVVDSRELLALAQAADIFQRIGRTAMGSDVIDGTILNDDAAAGVESVVSIGAELGRDDPERLASFLEAAQRAGLAILDLNGGEDNTEEDDAPDVIEGSVTEGVPVNISTKQIESGQ